MNAFTDLVLKSWLVLLVLLVLQAPSLSITIKSNTIPNIFSKRKIQLKPTIINCFLNDVVRISAPIISGKDQYYISKPNGEISKLDLHVPKQIKQRKTNIFIDNTITATFKENASAILQQSEHFDVFTVKNLKKKLKHMQKNDFLIGPLLEEDHGNWLLSIFTKGTDAEWIELFQTITISITEYTILEPRPPVLHIGDTFSLSFAYFIPSIETCEIVAPRSTFDRFYTRSVPNFRRCGFLVPNITMDDEGIWKIIGVGRIVYEGVIKLDVINDSIRCLVITSERLKRKSSLENLQKAFEDIITKKLSIGKAAESYFVKNNNFRPLEEDCYKITRDWKKPIIHR